MDLTLELAIVPTTWKNNSRINGYLAECWTAIFGYCTGCGKKLIPTKTNEPCKDFYCVCRESYEQKSTKKGNFGRKHLSGSYDKTIEKILQNNGPNYLFLGHNSKKVENFFVIPKHIFTPDIIEKRKPLGPTAKRAGWVGCNILLDRIPNIAKISIVKDGVIINKAKVIENFNKAKFIAKSDLETKGWLLDIICCIEELKKTEFTLQELYKYEKYLQKLHPENHNIKDKIRQKLQVLRDNEYLEFVERGKYKLIK